MNSIDFTLGVFLTKDEYTLLDWMHNCDSKGKPYERDSRLYVPLDHLSEVEILLRQYISKSSIDSEFYVNMFKDNPLGLNKIETIKFLNRILLKVFFNEPISLVIVNGERSYKISNGGNDEVSSMVPIRFDVKDAYRHPLICGEIEFNDRMQELFDIRWGGLLIRNVEYDDVMVVFLSDVKSVNSSNISFSLVNKVIAYNGAKLSENSLYWAPPSRDIFIPGAPVGNALFNAVVAGNQEAIVGGALNIDEAGDFFDDSAFTNEAAVIEAAAGGEMPF